MSPVSAPSDRRFRRAHVKPARGRRDWRAHAKGLARWAVIVALLGYATYLGTRVVIHARVLQVDHIVVGGNERLSNGEVLAVLAGLRGESLVWTDLDSWRRRLLASPWVRDAALRRSLPSTVEVVVWERQPVGIARIRGDMYLVDEQGVIIDQYGPQYADLDLPIIDGLVAPGGGSATDEGRAGLAARVIAAVKPRPDLARRLSQIDVSDLHDASVILDGDPAVLHLGDDLFLARLANYIELAPTLRDRVSDIDYVDLRFDERIYVRPIGKPGRTASASLPSAPGGARAAAPPKRSGHGAAVPQVTKKKP